MINPKNKRFSILLSGAILLNIVSNYFRIAHWPYGTEMMWGSLSLLGIFYSFRYYLKQLKNSKDLVKLIMVLSWILMNIIVFSKMQHIEYAKFILFIATLIWLGLEVFDAITKNHPEDKFNFIIWCGLILMMFYVIFKMRHFPGAAIPRLLGPIILSIGFLVEGIQLMTKEK